MLADVWVISMMFLGVMSTIGDYDIAIKDIISSLLPSTFATNWYITCYILFYAIHIWLNWIIEKLTQKQLLNSCIIMLGMYFGVNYIVYGILFVSNLITFITIYFVVAYIKLYMTDFCQSVWKNIIVVMVGILGICSLTLVTNFLGLHISFFENKANYWGGNNSPFFLMIAISLFNIFNKMNFRIKMINYISGLTFLIYIIHENILFRTYVRPQIWIYIYHSIGYEHVLLCDIIYASVLFATSILAAMLYRVLIQKWIYAITDKVSDRIIRIYSSICDYIIKIS